MLLLPSKAACTLHQPPAEHHLVEGGCTAANTRPSTSVGQVAATLMAAAAL